MDLPDSFNIGYCYTMRYGYGVMVNKDLIKISWNFVIVVAISLWALFVKMISLFAMSAETSNSDQALDNSVRGGLLNYRTGKLDDGTDATGWYEKD